MDCKILIVDDDPGIVRLVTKALNSNAYETDSASDGTAALEMAAKKEDYSLIITDIVMPQMSGLDFLRSLIEVKPNTPIILISGYTEFAFALEAIKLGAIAYLVKPFDKSELIKLVDKIISLAKKCHAHDTLFSHVTAEKQELVIDTATLMDKNNFSQLTGEMADRFIEFKRAEKIGALKVVLAIHEALRNSLEHGNLELPSDIKPELIDAEEDPYEKLLRERLEDPKYAKRKIWLTYSRTEEKAELIIRDDGKGFDGSKTLDQKQDTDIGHHHGMILIRAGVDKVSYNEAGNEIALTCYGAK
ncbi:MAG: response regulator [Nitrospinota bacterium]